MGYSQTYIHQIFVIRLIILRATKEEKKFEAVRFVWVFAI